MSQNADDTASDDTCQTRQAENLGQKDDPHVLDYNDVIENVSSEMIGYVSENPNYVQCLLHIKAYRDYHRGEKEEFNERIEVLDERYKRYNTIIDSMQIMIIVFSAGAAFVQGGNSIFNISDNVLRFIGLCVSSWTALALSVAKYYKLDEQKESMNNLRQQCSDLVSELGAREDRLNTLCSKEIWAGPPGAPPPPAVTAWENERDEMYNSLKTMIQKKQSLVAIFDQLMDSQESKKLILASKSKSLFYKKEKLKLDRQFLDYAVDRNKHNDAKLRLDGRKHTRKVADMSRMQPNGMFNARSAAPASHVHHFSPNQAARGYNDRVRVDAAEEEMRRMEMEMREERHNRQQRESDLTKHIIELRQQNAALQDRMNRPVDEETGHAGILKHGRLHHKSEDEEIDEALDRFDKLYTREEQEEMRRRDEERNYREGQKTRARIESEMAVNEHMPPEEKRKTLELLKEHFPSKEEVQNVRLDYEAKAEPKSDPVSDEYKRLNGASQDMGKYEEEFDSDRDETVVNIDQGADSKAGAKVPLQDKQNANETIDEEDSLDGSSKA